MYIEWAVSGEIEAASPGFNLSQVGLGGLLVTESQLPIVVPLGFLVCFRMDDGDFATETRYDYILDVSGPDGLQTQIPRRVANRADSSPQLADPERMFLPDEVDVTVTRAGQHTVTIRDATGVRYVLPWVFAVLPEP